MLVKTFPWNLIRVDCYTVANTWPSPIWWTITLLQFAWEIWKLLRDASYQKVYCSGRNNDLSCVTFRRFGSCNHEFRQEPSIGLATQKKVRRSWKSLWSILKSRLIRLQSSPRRIQPKRLNSDCNRTLSLGKNNLFESTTGGSSLAKSGKAARLKRWVDLVLQYKKALNVQALTLLRSALIVAKLVVALKEAS